MDFRLHANYMRWWWGGGDGIFSRPRPWSKADCSLNPGSSHSLCAPGHVTTLPASQSPRLGNSMGTPAFVERVKVPDIHSMPDINRHLNLAVSFWLQHHGWSPVLRAGGAKWKSHHPCPRVAAQYWRCRNAQLTTYTYCIMTQVLTKHVKGAPNMTRGKGQSEMSFQKECRGGKAWAKL